MSSKNGKKKQKNRDVTVLAIICAVIAVVIAVLVIRQVNGESKAGKSSGESSTATASSQLPKTDSDGSKEGSGTSGQKSGETSGDPAAGPSQKKSGSGEEAVPGTTTDSGTDPAADSGEGETQQTPEKPVSVLSPDVIESVYGYLVRLSDGSVVLDKNSQELMYPASMTKVLTALVAIEQLPNLDETVLMTQELINPLYEEGASLAGFVAGEAVTVRDLLYGVLLPSGAEASLALAQRIAGSEEAFVALMNEKAAALGMTNTHFTNCTGLHAPDHYTTCRDMELLFETALQNETFRQIITTDIYHCEPNEFHEEGLYLMSTMFYYLGSPYLDNGAVILGGKTGTTDEAGTCLVSFADCGGERYILVTGQGGFTAEGERYNIIDARNAYGSLQ